MYIHRSHDNGRKLWEGDIAYDVSPSLNLSTLTAPDAWEAKLWFFVPGNIVLWEDSRVMYIAHSCTSFYPWRVCVSDPPHLGNTERAPVRLDSMFSPTALSQEKATVLMPPFCHERNSRVRVPHFRTWKYVIVETLWITSRRGSV